MTSLVARLRGSEAPRWPAPARRALISAMLVTQLPGPNCVYLGQELEFTAPVKIGDAVMTAVTVTEKRDDKRIH